MARAVGLVVLACGAMLFAPPPASSAEPARHPLADAPKGPVRTGPPTRTGPPARAPAGDSLLSAPGASEHGSSEGPVRPQADPLVSNGLGSPACGSPLSAELGPGNRRDCETSGFTAAGAPTANFGLDVHIDTGLIPLSGASLLSTVQDLFVAPLWLAVVWLVHVLVVMIEWSFGLDLVEGSSARGLQSTLSHAGRVLTTPLLALALSIAAGLLAYHGLVRRRVGQTLGETLAMLVMIGGGTWLMVDPAGTVGALSAWSGEAGLGTLAATADGAPASPGRVLAQGMSAVFAATVEAPWCYLEFGDVAWCREPARLERSLHEAGLRLAARELREAHCAGASCAGDSRLASSARLLREARTNGEEFLAFPPNGPERNSINDTSSLLRTLCRSSDATACNGPGASEAQFRTNSGTWPRVGGLMLILIGALGMLLLLGWIGLRLLLAAILSLFYLLLTPGIVLVPVLGESGRSAFRGWIGRLFGAVLAKLTYAFMLGVVLAVMAVLEGLSGLGWWADWMLLTAFWWGVFVKRHEILARAPSAAGASSSTARATRALKLRRELRELRDRGARHRRNAGTDGRERTRPRAPVRRASSSREPPLSGPGATPLGDEQARRLQASRRPPSSRVRREAGRRLTAKRAQLVRVQRERELAARTGEYRRAAKLSVREARVQRELAEDHEMRGHEAVAAWIGSPRGASKAGIESSSAALDRQAEMPSALERTRGERGRDYPALVGLVGLTRERYDELEVPSQRKARLEIDRALNARRMQRGLRRGGAAPEGEARGGRARGASGGSRGAREPLRPERRESAVLRDAREVSEGRKEELGFGHP